MKLYKDTTGQVFGFDAWQKVPAELTELTAAEVEAHINPEPVLQLDVFSIDKREIVADGADQAVLTYTSESDVAFIVDGEVYIVSPVDSVATLEVSADGPGAILYSVRGNQDAIIAIEGPA